MSALLIGAGALAAGAGLGYLGGGPEGTVNAQPYNSKNAFFQPRLLQFLALGGQPEPITRAEYKKLPKSQRFKFAGSYFSGESLSAEAFEKVASQRSARLEELQRQNFKQLKDSPLFESLFADSQRLPSLSPAFAELSKQALGGAAQSGLNINDPATQAKILGPQALQAMLAQRDLQRNAGQSLLGALRGPGSAFADAQGSVGGIPFYTNNFYNSAGLQLGGQQFNASARNEKDGAQAGALLNLGGGLLGAGLSGDGGGGGGGAQPTPQYNNIGGILSGQFLQPYGYSPIG
jgi:hypothetical protein